MDKSSCEMSVGEALDADAHEVDVINLAALMELPVHTTATEKLADRQADVR